MKQNVAVNNLFSVDIEDWFHILEVDSTPDIGMWDKTTSRLEKNTDKTLELLSDSNVKATFFVLGWAAETYPFLIKKINDQGHEVASHGYAHELIYEQTPQQFEEDIKKAKEIIEALTGKAVKGYRAPGFSLTEKTPWAFEKIVEVGYKFDSSVFPGKRNHGGLKTENLAPYTINTKSGSLMEFPISVINIFGKPFCFFGGGYLRISPYWLMKFTKEKINLTGRPIIYYMHPREIDIDHPRIKMNIVRYFKSYVNVGNNAENKIKRVLKDNNFITFDEYMINLNEGQTQTYKLHNKL